MLDEDLRYVHLNQALADMDGLPVGEHIGRRMADVMGACDDAGFQRLLRGVAEKGRPVVGHLIGVRHRGCDQVRSVSLFPLTRAVGTRRCRRTGTRRHRPGAGSRGGGGVTRATGAAGPGHRPDRHHPGREGDCGRTRRRRGPGLRRRVRGGGRGLDGRTRGVRPAPAAGHAPDRRQDGAAAA
ncbi:PAS domain-containing protein [Streptomyces sp. enrichment culture]|uniref:PAS domain-containing protein n=1 Tax=Streptomyces sp. enrichment culture TaxID=1795815 RepID=UPI003F548240